MKNILRISLLFVSIALVSCQDVIDIKLRDADKKYVVECALVEGTNESRLVLTQTNSFFSTERNAGISGATVRVFLPDGSAQDMADLGAGVYSAQFDVEDSSTYRLLIEVNGQQFESTTTVPPHIGIDTLTYELASAFGSGGSGDSVKYQIFVDFQDPVGKNWYKINTVVNGRAKNSADDILVLDDNLNDGTLIVIPIFTQTFNPYDTVQVELQGIDKATYDFWNTLSQVASSGAGSPFSAAPANPVSNISNSRLGIFAGYSSSKREIIILP
jgi:hypothetical protein